MEGSSQQKAAGDEGALRWWRGGLSFPMMQPCGGCIARRPTARHCRQQMRGVDLLTMTPAAAFRAGRYEEAIERYSAALDGSGEQASTLCNRSLAALNLGRHPGLVRPPPLLGTPMLPECASQA